MRREIDVLFVFPPTGWTQAAMKIAENDAPPLGLLYVAASARDAGYSVDAIDMNHPPCGAPELEAQIRRMRPSVVAFSVLTTSQPVVVSLVGHLREKFPNICIVCGGIHATVLPNELLDCGVDYVVRGEGEEVMVGLLDRLSSGRLGSGMALDNSIVSSVSALREAGADERPVRPRAVSRAGHVCKDLDILPLPARDLVPLLDYGQAGAVCSTRGCPHSCSFCSSVFSRAHRYRCRRPELVVDEMVTLSKTYGLKHFQFLDDNFAVNLDRAATITRLISTLGFVWSCQTSVMEVARSPGLLDQMYQAGCRQLYFGLESGSERVLSTYKNMALHEALQVIRYASELHRRFGDTDKDRMQVVVGFIVGHPEDDEQSILETIDLAVELRKIGVDTMVSLLQPYPGSAIAQSPERYGVKIESRDYSKYLYPVANMSVRALSRRDLRRIYSAGLLRIMKTYET